MNRKLREHKANVFALLFNDKKEALKLYNAVNGTHYENYDDVEISTLTDEDGNLTGISAKMKNDVSFIFENTNNFYEHQSTVNRNMPLRFLLYLSEEVRRDNPGHRLLRRTVNRIPTPVFIVFYNGDEEVPEQYEMKLSDLYEKRIEDTALELTVRVYNINKGHNKDLMKACITLGQFAEFTARAKDSVRKTKDKKEQKNKLMSVINECIDEGILSEFLKRYKEEIVDDYLLFTSEDYEKAALEDLQYMQEELDKKDRKIDEKDKELDRKDREIDEKDKELDKKDRKINEKDIEIEDLKSRLSRYETV